MNTKNLFTMALALVFAGCSSDDAPEQDPQEPQGGVVKIPVHITADGGSDSASKARKIQGTDTGSELTFVWEDEKKDKIAVFAGDGSPATYNLFDNLTSGAGTSKAEFDGTLEYNQTANGGVVKSSDTPVYSYIYNANITYKDTDYTATLDLKEQDGSLNGALAHTFFWAKTTFGNGNDIHFSYKNQMSIMKFNISDLGNDVNGTGSVTFIADTGMPNSVTFNIKTGVLTPGTGTYVKATNVTFSNGTATVYLAIAPNATDAITNAEVRIDVGGKTYWKSFSNKNISANTIKKGKLYPQNVKNAKKLEVGSVLYADGTWGTKAETEQVDKSKILGVVGDINPTEEDIEAGYHHGYAIYRENLPYGKDYKWGNEFSSSYNSHIISSNYVSTCFTNITYPSFTPSSNNQTDFVNALEAEGSGLKLTKTLEGLKCGVGSGENHDAFPAAHYAYEQTWDGKTKGAQPFLPTAGEMFRVLTNLEILNTSGTFSSHNGSAVQTWSWDVTNFDKMDTTLKLNCKDGSTNSTINMTLDVNPATSLSYYWTTTEYQNNNALSFYLQTNAISGNSKFVFDAQVKLDSKVVRPLVAF